MNETLYVPYTRLGEATRVFLASPLYTPCPVTLVDVSGNEGAYLAYLKAVWGRGESFINMEHDIVPWPGAVKELLGCGHPWCFYGYDQGLDCAANGCAQFGLVRFKSAIIGALPRVWEVYIDHHRYCHEHPWRGMDVHFFRYARERGHYPHQHHPAVFNANPGILKNFGDHPVWVIE